MIVNIKKMAQIRILAIAMSRRLIHQRANMLLVICLFINAMIASTLGYFSLGVESALNHDISKFLGAPLVVSSDKLLPGQWWQDMDISNPAQTISFTTGVIGANGYHSIALKAVSRNYPLDDGVLIKHDSGNGVMTYNANGSEIKKFSAWLDARAMNELGVKQGDHIQLGSQAFNVSAELSFEPDRLTQLQHILPRIMISTTDLDAIGLDQNNGRWEFRYLFNDTSSKLDQLEVNMADSIKQPYQLLKPNAGQHPFSRMAQRAEGLLGLVTVLVLLMCGGASAVLADSAIKRYTIPASVLRCMGLDRNTVSMALLLQLTMLAVLGALLGCLLGWLTQPLLKNLLAPHLILVNVPFNLKILGYTLIITVLTIMAFIYPRLRAIGSMPIINILRRQFSLSKGYLLSIISALICVVILLSLYTDNIQLTLYLSLGVTTIVVLSIGFGWSLSKLTAQFYHCTSGITRIVIRSIGRKSQKHIAPMATVALSVMAFLMIDTLNNSFIETYQVQLFKHDGNFLFSRLNAEDLSEFRKTLDTNQIEIKSIYPTVRAKFVSINGVFLEQALSRQSDTSEEARSPVRLSWSSQLPKNNTLLAGQWPQSIADGVSVESEVMDDLDLKMGDQLGFMINDQLLVSEITSRRAFKSGGSMIMFWFMFSPQTMLNFQHDYMGGVEIDAQNSQVIEQLIAKFPQVLFTDMQQQMQRIYAIMNAIMKIMSSIMFLLLCAATAVLIASVFVGMQSYQLQFNLMRTLGVNKKRLYVMTTMEQGVIGIVACLVGIIGAQLISGVIFEQLFSLPFQANFSQYSLIILFVTLSFIAVGLMINYFNLKKPIKLSNQAF